MQGLEGFGIAIARGEIKWMGALANLLIVICRGPGVDTSQGREAAGGLAVQPSTADSRRKKYGPKAVSKALPAVNA